MQTAQTRVFNKRAENFRVNIKPVLYIALIATLFGQPHGLYLLFPSYSQVLLAILLFLSFVIALGKISRGDFTLPYLNIWIPIGLFFSLSFLSLTYVEHYPHAVRILGSMVFKIVVFAAIIELCKREEDFRQILRIIALLGTLFSLQGLILMMGVSMLGFKPVYGMIKQDALGALVDIDYGLAFFPFWGFVKAYVPGTHIPRCQGMFIEPGHFSDFLQLSIFATLAYITFPVEGNRPERRAIHYTQAGVQFAALFFSFSTAGWIATGVGVLFFFLFSIRQQMAKIAKKILLLISTIALVIMVSFCFFTDTAIALYNTVWVSKFVPNPEGETSSETRLRVMGQGIGYFLERPLSGWGIAESRIMAEGSVLNNAFITAAAELGVLGLLAYLAMLFAIGLTMVNTLLILRRKDLRIYMTRSVWIFCCFVGLFVDSMFREIQWSFIYWIGAALLYSNYRLLCRKGKEKVHG